MRRKSYRTTIGGLGLLTTKSNEEFTPIKDDMGILCCVNGATTERSGINLTTCGTLESLLDIRFDDCCNITMCSALLEVLNG